MKLTFKDGEKSVDYILAYDTFKEDTNHIRKAFEENLIKEGLEIEMENSQQQINFVKIHAPMEVLARYCQLLKLKLPLKVSKEGCHLSKFERKLLDKEILCEFTSQRKDL
uniref:Anoctamin dimerisation domain-containing protein n=1 Tax=Megaselia scalaris TaxID=36166 RepID=T1GN27_MEGSC